MRRCGRVGRGVSLRMGLELSKLMLGSILSWPVAQSVANGFSETVGNLLMFIRVASVTVPLHSNRTVTKITTKLLLASQSNTSPL